jgi:hypothetical protein
MNDGSRAEANEGKAGADSSARITISDGKKNGWTHMKLTEQAVKAILCMGALSLAGQAMASSSKVVVRNTGNTSVASQVVGAGGMEVITPATGGESISASTAGAAWTTLNGPTISETYARDTGGPGLGTIVLNAPAGFEFNPEALVTVVVNGYGHKTINQVPDGGTIPTVVTPRSITLTITSVSRGGLAFPDKLTFQNIQVRPTSGQSLASGYINETGSCQFRNLSVAQQGGWGFLHEVGAAIPNIILADPLGDWDGDGRSNLIEYALGTDPTNPNDNTMGMQIWIMDIAGNNYLALGYRQRTTAGLPLAYTPEVSGDKQAWYSDASHVLGLATTSIDAQFNWITVRDTTPLSPSTPRFIRLTVTQN